MIRTTQWGPDTCGCVMKYTWDDSIPEDQREHTASEFVKKCEKHSHIDDVHEAFEAVKSRNIDKNLILEEVKKSVPQDKHRDISFEYDHKDELVIKIPEPDGVTKQDISDGVKVNFGDKKFRIE